MGDVIEVLEGRATDLGEGFAVRRVLPRATRRQVGPFVFLDHFGPADVAPGRPDVRPHPHIGLATVTWLFAGSMRHRDSLGSDVEIRPGAVNWMSAGRGIVHSERNLAYAGPMHGLQMWVALPAGAEDGEPSFQHVPAERIPAFDGPGVRGRAVVGSWAGERSPVVTASPTIYVDVALSAGGRFEGERPASELAIFVVEGEVAVGDTRLASGRLGVLGERPVDVRSPSGARLVLIGGEPLGPRRMWWNFVHTDPARIEAAKADWASGRFPQVPGEADVVPLP